MNISKIRSFALFSFMSVLPAQVFAQVNAAQPQIIQPVDETKLTVLRGNTHPLARPEFDRGAAPSSLAMGHMLLVLKRSASQEAALETLLAQQQDKSSPNYRKWLTSEQFGEQFGPSVQDIQTVTTWLQSHGFQIGQVSHGRTLIDISGTAGQVQQAFHTTIHRYVLANGEQHWSNSSDPEIPTALASVVVGVNKLNDFHPKAMHHMSGTFKKSLATGKVSAANPKFTYPGECYTSDSTNCYAIGPSDFDKIYNVPTTVSGAVAGAGETIAIVSDSDVYDSDVTNFRSLLGLSAVPNPGNVVTRVIPTGLTNPGVQGPSCEVNQDEEEAIIDVEWAGAAAPGALLDLVISPSNPNCSNVATEPGFTNGFDYSAQWIVDDMSPVPPVLSDSYGDCELLQGTAENAFYNSTWQQAAAEGITVLVAAGDSGSAGCDYFDTSIDLTVQPAEYGLQVDGAASTPYNVAVGGTDFDYSNFNNPSAYWSTNNTTSGTTTTASALGYIPEMAWDDTCTNSVIYLGQISGLPGFGSAASACNSAAEQEYYLVGPIGGSGGASNCTTPSGSVPADCAGGYAKPFWQVGTGVPADGMRDIPDVSLFGSDGTVSGTAYIVCEEDLNPTPSPCSLAQETEYEGEPYFYFVAEGGTSVSAQAFAGIVALMNQKLGAHGLGNINPMLYALAGEPSASVFHDVTVGTNAMPCLASTANCTVVGSNEIGVLSGYSTGTGYDLATGLGSVNVTNLVSNAGPNFYVASSSPTVTVPAAGDSGMMTFTLTSVDGFAGSVALACSGLPTGATCVFSPPSPITLIASGAGSSQTIMVTVNTTSASWVFPTGHPRGGWRTLQNEIALAFLFCMGAVLYYFRENRWRLSAALAIVTLAVAIGIAGCGGGSSGGGGGGGGSGTTTPNITAISGSVTYNMSFTLTID